LQKPQLHNDQKQEEAFGTLGNEEVLQYVPEADGAQGSEVRKSGAEKRLNFAREFAGDSGESSNG
jgi:hypothetical protein